MRERFFPFIRSFSVISSFQTITIYLYIFFLAHFGTSEEYGNYMAISYIVDFSVAIGMLGSNLLILRENINFLRKKLLSYVVLSLAALIIVYVGYVLFIKHLSLVYFSLGFILMVGNYFYQIIFTLLVKFRLNNTAFTVVFVNIFIILVLLIGLSYFKILNSFSVICIRILQVILVFIFSIKILCINVQRLNFCSLKSIKNCFVSSMSLSGGTILATTSQYVDKFIVSTLKSVEIAKYSVARFDIPFIGIFLNNISYVYMERIRESFINADKAAVKNYIRTLVLYGWYFNVITFTLLFFNSELVINVFFSSSYLDANPLFRIVLLSYLVKIVPYTNIIVALGLERIIIKRIIIELFLQIISSFTLLYFFGIIGLALSLVIVLICWSVPYNFYYYSKAIKCSVIELLPLNKMLKFGVKCVIPCWCMEIFFKTYINNEWILFAVLTSVIFVLCQKQIKFILKNTK